MYILSVCVVLSSWMCESVLMPLCACYVVLLSPVVLMDVRVHLEWMSGMMCYVVLMLLLVLMDERVCLEWMSAMT